MARRAQFQDALLAWYRAHRRPLPWRESPSPYSTVVSEFMLQQTQVATATPYFRRWMAALPDFAALAAASEATVLRLWEGLGYYSRARNLHRLARLVASAGRLPRTASAWEELPGVGPYTAAAIASIAFGEPRACVDGNVVRILARLTRDATRYRDSACASKAFAPLAQGLVNPGAPGDHNQAMMELGATVCLRRRPACPACPVRGFCACARAGDPGDFPRMEPRKTERRSVVRVWCERAGAVLLYRNGSGARRLADLHELPTARQAGLDPARVSKGPLVARNARTITRFRIVESIHSARQPPGNPGPGLVWVRLEDLGRVALSGPHRRWTTQILSHRKG
ncbi:MAG TPA: A/G-specific adenine glycosylase [Candidatus Sulfotelmatobacter sp.]|nr:A/G-specific adenine glycosylase [Candidatus Sulfotelmatobacter sp.]